MKAYTVALVLLALVIAAAPAMAARATVAPICHPEQQVSQAYPGTSQFNVGFRGLDGYDGKPITAAPGILWIIPQDKNEPAWANYVSAAAADVPYTIKNIVLRKCVPETIQGTDRYEPLTIVQQGTPNIRLWWPLMYEIPGTTWTLTITYGTPSWADPANPGFPSTVHQDIWTWKVGADFQSLAYALDLFHQVPFGLDEVPVISDECLFPYLKCLVAEINSLYTNMKMAEAGELLAYFELEVADACITTSPRYPYPTGPGTGIANSYENPACAKILIDCEYIGFNTGIYQPAK